MNKGMQVHGIYSGDLDVHIAAAAAAVTGDSILKKYTNSNRVVCVYQKLEIGWARVLNK
jgi:hypothetical protein